MNGDKWVVAKLQISIAGSARISASVRAAAKDSGETVDALLVLTACVPVPPGTEEGKKEDRRRSQVVLERVGEEERTHAECDQGQLQTEPAQQARVATERQGHACGGATHDGEDRQRGDKDSDEDEHPDQPTPDVFAERATNPGLLGWIGVLLWAPRRKTHPGLRLFR